MASEEPPTMIVNKLQILRNSMKTSSLHAYLVPSVDSHQSEYISSADKRLEFISGFSGSRGFAAITLNKAALWTDGRYFLEAEKQLDANEWILMKEGVPKTPTVSEWLNKVLDSGSQVGVDSRLFTNPFIMEMEITLDRQRNVIVGNASNLIDEIWGGERPSFTANQLVHVPLIITGKSFSEKLNEIRAVMNESQSGMLVLSALDEIAWLFNMRGTTDIKFNPVFYAYCLIEPNAVRLFVHSERVEQVTQFLEDSQTNDSIQVISYDQFYDVVSTRFEQYLHDDANKDNLVWIPGDSSSYATYSLCTAKYRCLSKASPVSLLKGVKNEVELKGMKDAQIQDSVAHCEFFYWLENQITTGEQVSEIEADDQFQKFRSQWPEYIGLSFDTISAAGSNGAIVHYKPTKASNAVINASELYLVDSGAQFNFGTTDITRTISFQDPSVYQKECYTRVLRGHINLARLKFPEETHGSRIDAVARMSLWQVGFDYAHGTGHGVGHHLCVHEGPAGFGIRQGQYSEGVRENMVLTIEPGYYEAGHFGIRIENEYVVVVAETQYSTKGKKFLTFAPITFVPFHRNLIEKSLLQDDEIAWINEYHRNCLRMIGSVLEHQGKLDVFEWLKKACQQI